MNGSHQWRARFVTVAIVLVAASCAVAVAKVAHKIVDELVGPGISIGSFPDALAVSPNGRTLYVADDNAPSAYGLVWPFDLATGQTGRAIRVGVAPSVLVMAPDGRTLFASNGDVINPIAVGTDTTGHPIRMGLGWGSLMQSLLLSPDGRTLYFSGESRIRSYDLATGTFGPDIRANWPEAMLLSHDGKTLWYAAADNQVVAVHLPAGAVKTRTKVPSEPVALAMSPDGRTLYVAVTGSNDRSHPAEVLPVNTATGSVGPGIRMHDPVAMAMAPDGRTLYVLATPQGTNGDGPTVPGWVTPITLATRTAGHPIGVGYDPTSIVITPNGKTLCVANQDGGTISVIPLTH
jgi:DNA-binding beta-propeller fold protein YncE